jgi:hypothetical protein
MAAAAAVVALLAWATSNRNYAYVPAKDLKGKAIFEKFTDPMAAASLKILRYDTPKEDYVEFEVAQDRKTNVWTIPSHESYPADASKQMSEAANLFVGLKAIDVASEKRSDQVLFGVVEPNKQNADKGGEGVGMLVQMRDAKGDILADLIIGKDNDKKQRFVRVPSEDVIYVAELDTTPLSTDFKQWIEADLLKLSSNDIENVSIRDYQIVPVNQGLALSRNYEADLTYVTNTAQWQANRITNFETNPATEKTVGENEQLNATKLNEMKNALDSLRIADVLRKPAGLAADLKGDKSLLSNQESLSSLQRRGFYPNPNQKEGDVVDFFSKSGELQVTLKDGVQYLLRFGNAAGAEIKSIDKKESDESKEEDVVSINRFLLVTTRVDESKFPQPELEKVPQSVEELKAMEELKKQSSAAPAIPTGEQANPVPVPPAGEAPVKEPAKPEEAAKEATNPSSTSGEEKPSAIEKNEESNSQPPGEKKPDDLSQRSSRGVSKFVSLQDPQSAPASAASQSAETPVAPTAQDTKDEKPATPSAERTEEEWKDLLSATQEKITKENKRKIDERNDKLQRAKKKVAELNGRFSDWYYVISEDDYKKMRISLTDLIQPKSASGPGAGAGFNPGGGFPGGGFPGGGFPGSPQP